MTFAYELRARLLRALEAIADGDFELATNILEDLLIETGES